MVRRFAQQMLAYCLLSSALSGCGGGLVVPNVYEPGGNAEQQVTNELVIIKQVKCEIEYAVQRSLSPTQEPDYEGNKIEWLRDWAAKVTLKITVDEKSTLTPGISVFQPFSNAVTPFQNGAVTTARSFNLGIGGQAMADATRIETIGFTYLFKDFATREAIQPISYYSKDENKCKHQDNLLIKSDLHIDEFLQGKLELVKEGEILRKLNPKNPFDVFSYQTTFITMYSGNVTPTWKFLRVSANTTSPFFSSSRQRTHDVQITFGPLEDKKENKSDQDRISRAAEDVHLANLIGQAVAAAIQSRQQQ